MPSLADLGIRLRDERPGEHRAACPRCAETKHRPRDDALAVKVELDDGATWTCHRCGWGGGGGPDPEHRRARRGPDRPPHRPEPERKPQPFSPLDAQRWGRARP